ncbi:hypothetical protein METBISCDRAFT_17380 [Metschnikowia bicuspidata]|uniref:Sulfhydryl oxidase n=1 Tax=Metschnikowia bicuspidata TaxID=27322 RepID=A0A4P9ZAX1_9ASCO|nr:hypothetical protein METBISCDRAFT_17380 [Metschnikowia bicuspidata]
MSKQRRKPFFNLTILALVVFSIYYVASSNTQLIPSIISSRGGRDEPQSKQTSRILQKSVNLADKEQKSVHAASADSESGLTDTPFMPKMENEVLKAKLGNSAWHLLHTVLARFPDEPSAAEKKTLKQFVYLFAQVYPCGDCARHFQKILKKYPPQVSSRKTVALWGCHIHNKVNERLNKDEYDCTQILEDYDCGCGDDEKSPDTTLNNESMTHLRQISVDEVSHRQAG